MMDSTDHDRARVGGWDWWPLARLLVTAGVLSLVAHHAWGWTPDFGQLARKPRQVFEVLSLAAVLSFALAHLYLMLLAFPVYAVVTLNDSLYDASHWTCRKVLEIRSSALLRLAGLCGEIALFGGLLMALRTLIIR